MDNILIGNVSLGWHLNLITSMLLKQYFVTCSLEVIDESRYKLQITPDLPRMIVEETNLQLIEDERCQNIFISTKNPLKAFALVEEFIKKRTEIRYNHRKYFLMPTDDDWTFPKCHDDTTTEEDCKQLKKLRFVWDVLLMRCDNTEKCAFYTYVIEEKRRIEWLHLDDWFFRNQSFLRNQDLYPSRLLDVDQIFGRTFRILHAGGINYLPYSLIELRKGMELRAIIEYSKRINFRLNITKDVEYWGAIYDNWTGPGVYGGVVSDNYDIGFGALFALPERIRFSDFSKPTTFSRVSCIVPAPRIVESWLTPVKGLSPQLWMAVIGLFLLIAVLLQCFKRFWINLDPRLGHMQMVSAFALFITQPVVNTQQPTTMPLRLIYTVLLVFSLLVATCYNSGLACIMVMPSYEGEIKTVRDLAVSGLLWGELAIDWALPLKVDKQPLYEIINRNFRVLDKDTLREYSLSNHFAFGTERLMTGYYAVGEYLKEDIIDKYRTMTSDLYRQYASLQLRKSSVLLPSIDIFLLHAWEFGLLYVWEVQINIYHMNYKIQQSLRNPPREDTVVKLEVHHIIGLFLIWIIGIVISSTTFVVELYYFRRQSTRKQLNNKL